MSKHVNKGIIFLLSALLTSLQLTAPAAGHAVQAALAQKQAISRIDAYIEHFRKTGDRATLLPELARAEAELTTSYKAFINTGDRASAALCLIKLGDVQCFQDRWDRALQFYRQAESLANKVGHTAYQAKALVGQARTELLGLRRYGDALAHIEQAIQLISRVEDKSHLFDALNIKAQVQIAQGELIAAFDTLSRAFSVAQNVHDQQSLLYAYLDRADIYLKFAEKCDYERTFEPCYEALARAKDDYSQALAIAKTLGYQGLAGFAESFLRHADMRRELIRSQERMHAMVAETSVFHPREPRDVLVHDKFLAAGSDLPPGLLAWIQQSGGFAKTGDARSLYIQGLLFDMQGDRDQALQAYLKAVDLLEQDRRRLRDEQSRGTFFEDKIEFYYAPILHLLERGRYAEAFDLMERSRSRGMADLLASRSVSLGSGKEQALYGAVQKARAEIARLQADLFVESNKPEPERSPETISRTGEELKKLEAEHRQLIDQMEREAPKARSLAVSAPVSLKML